MCAAAGRYDLPVPEIQVFDDMFRVNLYCGRYRVVQDNVDNLFVEDRDMSEKFGKSSEKVRRKASVD